MEKKPTINKAPETEEVSIQEDALANNQSTQLLTQSVNWRLLTGIAGSAFIALTAIGSILLLPDLNGSNSANQRDRSSENQHQQEHDLSDKLDVQLVASMNPVEPLQQMKLMHVVDAKERGAICNDGSDAAFYFRPGTEEFKDKWIIFFEGGGACGNEESCIHRKAKESPALMSSRPYAAYQKENGIFSVNPDRNTDFYGWNHIMLKYCSSDSWVGNAEQEIGGETWYFHGKTIVEAIIDDLKNPDITKTATLSEATEVLIAGSSAGGTGVAQNIDDIAAELNHAQVKGLIDSSWSAGTDMYATTEHTEDYTRETVNTFHNKQLDDTCITALQENADNCTLFPELYPYIETPVFIFINQLDRKKVENTGITHPIDEKERTWLDNIFIPELLTSFEVIENGLFAPRETFHTLLIREQYYSTVINEVSFAEAFTNWYFDRPGETYLVE